MPLRTYKVLGIGNTEFLERQRCGLGLNKGLVESLIKNQLIASKSFFELFTFRVRGKEGEREREKH